MDQGSIQLGIVAGYDPQTMTATIVNYSNDIESGVSIPLTRYEEGACSASPPSVGSCCLYTTVNGQSHLISMFAPPNMDDSGTEDFVNPYETYYNRAPTNMSSRETLPGETMNLNAKGGEDSFGDDFKRIVLSPDKLYTKWNLMNNKLDTKCIQYAFRSSGLDITSTAASASDDGANPTNTVIDLKKSMAQDPPAIRIKAGAEAGVIEIYIEGTRLLKVDKDRNVILTAKKIDLTATDININADKVDCLNVGKVYLP